MKPVAITDVKRQTKIKAENGKGKADLQAVSDKLDYVILLLKEGKPNG